MNLRFAVVLLLSPLAAQASSITVSQTATLPQIDGFGGAETQVTFSNLPSSNITRVEFAFTTTDPDFNGGVGPTGGDSGVSLSVESTGGRAGLVSFLPGNQDVAFFPTTLDPQQRFALLVSELSDGELTLSLGAFENFPTMLFSRPFPLDQPSTLTIRVQTIPEPTSLVSVLGLAGLAAASRRKR